MSASNFFRRWGRATYGRDVPWQGNRLDDVHSSLLDGAFEVDVCDLLAEVFFHVYNGDEAHFDGQMDLGVLLDGGFDGPRGIDDQIIAPIHRLVVAGEGGR